MTDEVYQDEDGKFWSVDPQYDDDLSFGYIGDEYD